MTPHTLSTPTICAAGILRAWRENDLDALNRELIHARCIALRPGEETAEWERAELLGSIAEELQGMMATGSTDGVAVCRSLLKHLADPYLGSVQ